MDVPLPKIAFDNKKYIELQTQAILERAERFGNKLYLEVGGKLLQDFHAARILPGFDPDVKIRMLQTLKDKIDVLVCVYARDIEQKRYRADFKTTYDNEVLRTIDEVRKHGLNVRAVVMSRYEPTMSAAENFAARLERSGIPVTKHSATVGYPDDVSRILSPEGYGLNPMVETERPIVCVIAPGPSSGKLATCLTQLYHENCRGGRAGYAKYETFPVWSLPLTHPVNIAYESATADIKDFNQIDPFHLEAYGKTAVSYNRDVAAFPILRELLGRIMGGDAYKSPTDMGVNMIGYGIVDDDAVRYASHQEIIRRMFHSSCNVTMGTADASELQQQQHIMQTLQLRETDRPVVKPAREAATCALETGKGFNGICCGAALQLHDGRIVTGKNSRMLYAASSVILNALKTLAEIPDWIHLLPENITEAVNLMKGRHLGLHSSNMNVEELLIALSISGLYNTAAKRAIEKLPELRGCDMHMTHITTPSDENGIRRLGIHLTTDPQHPSKELFVQ